MTAAWKIASNAELQDVAEAGTGFVVDPFNRWWHVATCPRIATMTVGEAKWFAPTRAALDTYLEDRLARHATAKPILACATCTGGGRIATRRRSVATSPNHEIADASARPPHVERSNACFEVWADECVRNESKAASSAGRLRSRIKTELAALPDPDGHVLHAAYAGVRSDFTDVENLLFNNIDQELSAFRRTGRFGVRFEDLGESPPVAPDGSSRPSFYRYRLAEPGEPLASVEPGRLVCGVPEVVVPDGSARLAARIWLAVRRARPSTCNGDPLEAGPYMLKLDVSGLDPATAFKALVDGASAAMQRDEPDRVRTAMGRLSLLLGVGEPELVDLATAPGAPLGTRSRRKPTSKDCLFTLDGPKQVRVTPDDDRCVAAEVRATGGGGDARLAVAVYSARRR